MTLTPGERTTLAAQIEAALLADGDGQAFVNAIVAAIGNVNVNQAVLIAAIRADLERAGGLLDVLPTLTEIEASAILAKAAQVPTAAAVATAVRTNLATELGRIDVAVSTRESEASAATRAAAAPTLVRADIERTGGMLDEKPTLTEIEESDVLAKQPVSGSGSGTWPNIF